MNTSNPKFAPLLLLFGRTALFIIIQAIFALGFAASGSPAAWDAAAAWWPFTVTIANFVCLATMIYLFRTEGKSYWEIFRIRRENILNDLLVLLGLLVIVGTLGFLPNILLSNLLFDNPQITLDLMIRPLPYWAAYAGMILFAITQGLTELPLYFAYVMPRLDNAPLPGPSTCDPAGAHAWIAAPGGALLVRHPFHHLARADVRPLCLRSGHHAALAAAPAAIYGIHPYADGSLLRRYAAQRGLLIETTSKLVRTRT